MYVSDKSMPVEYQHCQCGMMLLHHVYAYVHAEFCTVLEMTLYRKTLPRGLFCVFVWGLTSYAHRRGQAQASYLLQQDRSERGAAKKKHSTIGHLWKAVKNDLLNPKAAAADLTAISVSAASMSMSAAKQAGQAMNTVANKVESDISSLHDQILGGKRNLPDHSREPCTQQIVGLFIQ